MPSSNKVLPDIAIIGAGHVGLTTAIVLAERGFSVRCLEIDSAKRSHIQSGQIPFAEKGMVPALESVIKSEHLSIHPSEWSCIGTSSLVFICVETPQDKEGQLDKRPILSALSMIGAGLKHHADWIDIIVRSTVPPGSTKGFIANALEETSNKKVGEHFGLACNPEFLRDGQGLEDFRQADRIVVGSEVSQTIDHILTVYNTWNCAKLRVQPSEAELIKYMSNLSLTMMMSYANEWNRILLSLGENLSFSNVLEGMQLDHRWNTKNQKLGLMDYLLPGPGFGGSCLPKDLNAIRQLARENDVSTPLFDAIATSNRNQLEEAYRWMESCLRKPLKEQTILLLGISHKTNTSTLTQSPGVLMYKRLLTDGCNVAAYDPNVEMETLQNMMDSPSKGLALIQSLEGLKDLALSSADVVIMVHPTLSLNDCLPILRARPSLPMFDLRGSWRHDITLPNYFSFFV
tara:strand:+ start:2753 stop:4129 length:1377 start_codon:yes stop_codon:yes gene_type:complete